MLAARATRIAVSPTMKVAAEAMALKAKGVDVVDLGAGEPDFPTPKHIGDAAKAAIDANFTKYTTNSGTDELKKAIVWRYKTDYGVDYATNEVIVTAGGKQALHHAAMVLVDSHDEVVTHTPGWPTIGEQVKLAGGTLRPVMLDPRDGFALKAAPLIGASGPATRAVVLNSPCNPTGAVMSEREAQTLAAEAARRDWWIVLDLCYDGLVFDGARHDLVRIFSETVRDSAPAKASGFSVFRKAMVLATRAFRSANVASLSSKRGGSWPARRAQVPLAMSVAICTWRDSGSMSG